MFVFSWQALHTESIIVGFSGIGESAMGIERAWVASRLSLGPEQHMVVTADPFLLGVDSEGVLRYDMIYFAQFRGMQSIEDVMKVLIS